MGKTKETTYLKKKQTKNHIYRGEEGQNITKNTEQKKMEDLDH